MLEVCEVCGRRLHETLINDLPEEEKIIKIFEPPLRTIFVHITRFAEAKAKVEVPENCIILTHPNNKYNIVDIPRLIEATNVFYEAPVSLEWMEKNGVLKVYDMYEYIKDAMESIKNNKPTKRGNLIGDAKFLEGFLYYDNCWFISWGS